MAGDTITAAASSLWSTFTSKAELVGAQVQCAATPEAAMALLAGAGPSLATTSTLRARFPDVARGCRSVVTRDPSATEVVAAAQFAVAETGSVCLNESNVDRGACFLADRLWLLVNVDDIVATLEAALERLGRLVLGGAHHAQLMTGPSRTADIERTLTIGVHGPGALVVVVIGPGGHP